MATGKAFLFASCCMAAGMATGASAPAVAPQREPVAKTTVSVGDVRVGFTIGMGKWVPAKNAKTSGGHGSDKAFVAAGVLPARSWRIVVK